CYHTHRERHDLPSCPTRRSSDLKVRETARKAREEARNGKKKRKDTLLSGKLTPAQSRNARKNELYLVEGDSCSVPESAFRTGERSEEHTSELQSRFDLVCRLLLE